MIKNIVDNNKNMDVNKDKMNKLKEMFPNCFNINGDFDISLFEDELKTNSSIVKEGYGLNFLGKNYAKYVTSLDTETILVPDEENNSKDENKNSENIYISGDNIDALKHLVKSYAGQIKCIYIDPPYNTGYDNFIYNDRFNLSKEKMIEVLDINEDEANRIYNLTNSKSNSHSAWLTFMYPRLYLGKQLLSNDGVIFISIDDNELSQLKLLCDNIFGEENFVGSISRATGTTTGQDANKIGSSLDYCLIYCKTDSFNLNGVELNEKDKQRFNEQDEKGIYSILQLRKTGTSDRKEDRENMFYAITAPDGTAVYPFGPDNKYLSRWRVGKDKYMILEQNNMIIWKKNNKNIVKIDNYESSNWIPYVKYYLDGRTKKVSNLLQNIEGNKKGSLQLKELFEINNLFDNPKPLEFLSILINIGSEDGDTILDFFGGSSSTAHSVLKINSENNGNRKFIIVQLPELCDTKSEAYKNGYKTIDEIGQERIRRAAKKIKEGTNADIDYGFKHYTIKEVNTNTLDKLEKFEPNYVISDGSILDEFGINAVLTTWMNEDGYGLTDKYEKLELEDYTAYKCQNTIYLLNWNISDLFIKALIEKYEKDENFDCNRIVMFGYSFTLNDIQTLKDNLQQVKNIKGINVEVITRY